MNVVGPLQLVRQWWISRIKTALVLLLMSLAFASCKEEKNSLVEITPKNGETPVEAVKRFFGMRGARELEILTLLSTTFDEINKKDLSNVENTCKKVSDFNRDIQGSTMFQVVSKFELSPAGAYLSDMDKTFISRLQTQHSESTRAILRKERAKDSIQSFESFLEMVRISDEQQAVLRNLDDATFQSFIDRILDKASESIPKEDIIEFAKDNKGDGPGYKIYKVNSNLFYKVTIASYQEIIREKIKQHLRSDNLESYFYTEIMYGIRDRHNVTLENIGYYKCIGDKNVSEFHNRIRKSLDDYVQRHTKLP